MNYAELKNRFEYHAPNEIRAVSHTKIRENCYAVADFFDVILPEGREKSLAITKLEEAMFWANAALAREN